jgi:hypothetical protein
MPTIIFIIFIIIGTAMMGWGFKSIYKSYASTNWPYVDGQLSSVEWKVDNDDGVLYRVEVKYDYIVNGVQFNNNEMYFGYSGSSNDSFHSAIYKRIKNNKIIRVYYNNSNHSESVLAVGVTSQHFIPVIFGAVFVGFAVGLWLLFAMMNIGNNDKIISTIVAH